MASIIVDHISKSFGTLKAVNDVSFEVQPGEIFGLLGPNGAGKTTAIRIILDIFKPDSGTVNILGGKMDEQKKNRIGYLPEERGLYQDIPLDRCLSYLASLKGLDTATSNKRIDEYLERFDLASAKKKKVKELSKGMQQKAQLITTLVHQPELIIIDEPFSALDPVNTQMVKDLLREQREQGKTIIMCTHQMHQVEELCDRLVLIDQGKALLYGSLTDVRKKFAKPSVFITTGDKLPDPIKGVGSVEKVNGDLLLHLINGTEPNDVLKTLVSKGVGLDRFEIALPTLDEIFIEVVKKQEGSR